MSNNYNKPNPKALKLEGLENINKKVTIGFKCHPKVKLHLATEAKKAGLTLSEFIETLIQELQSAVEMERQEIQSLKEKIAFYENAALLKLFKEHEKQEVAFVNASGEKVKIMISEPKDVYTVVINSFKPKQ